MTREKCIEKLRTEGYKAEEGQSGIVFCYECEDHDAFREAVKATGYDRSFGSTPHTKEEYEKKSTK